MARLDRTRPYGHTVGPDYQYLEQDGRQFTMAGLPMDGSDAEPEPSPIAPIKAATQAATPKVADSADNELSDLSNDELKTLVTINGGKWSGRDAAIKFLSEA